MIRRLQREFPKNICCFQEITRQGTQWHLAKKMGRWTFPLQRSIGPENTQSFAL